MLRRVIITIFLTWGCLTQACYANVNLSVNPVDGSSSLRFDATTRSAVENKKEIHIRVSSPNGDRYQIFQRVLEPMVNEKGDVLDLQAVETQALTNSNSYGTLYLQNSDHLSMGDQLLYSSGQGGQSDAFIVGYSLNQNLINSGGNFRGRLVFTVRAMGNASSDQVTIDMFLKTSPSLKITVKGAHNPSWIRVRGSDTSEREADYLNVSFSGNGGQEIRIYQELDPMPQNETDQILGQDVLQFDPQGNTEALHIHGPNPLVSRRTLIYSGNKDEDNFLIYFLMNADQAHQQDAGIYKGKIKYTVETDHGRQEFPIDLQGEISPVFTVNVTPPLGGLNYAHVLANTPAQDKDVQITVQTNLHKPYQVFQGVQTAMTNSQGKEFNNKYFNLQVEIPSGQKGQTDFTEFSPVQTGEYPVFSSDAQGSGATFTVVYRLQGYTGMSAGDFSVPIRYSLNQK